MYLDPIKQREAYLRIGEVQLVNKLGERVNVKPEEAEIYYSKGYGHEVVLYHPTESPYNNDNPAASGRVFLDFDVEEAIAQGWSRLPVWEGMEGRELQKPEEKKAPKKGR